MYLDHENINFSNKILNNNLQKHRYDLNKLYLNKKILNTKNNLFNNTINKKFYNNFSNNKVEEKQNYFIGDYYEQNYKKPYKIKTDFKKNFACINYVKPNFKKNSHGENIKNDYITSDDLHHKNVFNDDCYLSMDSLTNSLIEQMEMSSLGFHKW
ncbi:MAG: hypothetical protein ACRCZK_06965 [Oscillospiraceae bacterium]